MSDMLERDPGFCSGGEDDDMEAEDGIHSPTDASEDSVDVKVQAISLRNKNKRKSAEPRRLDTDLPAKKRKIDLTVVKNEKEETRNCSPFRPWSTSPSSQNSRDEPSRYPQVRAKHDADPRSTNLTNELSVIFMPRLPSPHHPPLPTNPSHARVSPLDIYPQDLSKVVRTIPNGVIEYPEAQNEPLSLVSKKRDRESEVKESGKPTIPVVSPALRSERGDARIHPDESARMWHSPTMLSTDPQRSDTPKEKDKCSVISRVRNCKTFGDKKVKGVSDSKPKSDDNLQHSDNKFRIDTLLSSSKTETRLPNSSGKPSQGGQQRNYKNMTRERRIEANARERTRVHTISAAFDTLRHSIPAYSHNQKLSKLSVLRIACSYIMTLSRLAGYDYSKDQSEPEISNCVENVSKTIQTEGKIRKKKDD